ncbi:hypothetical protein MSG28_007239 [Choristoneura fumiferana]|uniref:Uncharacterized protein n=3 Tax=Choristoneura fumiferana TaxID=7141 RepID=A0ACC0JWB3_CHOFU|nr:hypothetical protein MSG28_007239 [Choristoneura fumiferana]
MDNEENMHALCFTETWITPSKLDLLRIDGYQLASSFCRTNCEGGGVLSEMGQDVGARLLDLYFVRERNSKREIKLLNMLLFVKSTLWKVNKFISVPKDKGSLNCATFNAGIIEAVLTKSGFVSQ